MSHFSDTYFKLEEWGRWSRDDCGLGYPSGSIEQKAYEGGGFLTKGSGFKEIYCPEHIEQVDSVVADLMARNRHLYKTICIHFIKGCNYTQMGKMPRFKRREYARADVKQAVSWVDARLF